MKFYNKLIRDNIPQIIENDGFEYDVEKLQSNDYRIKLNEKLNEELEEYYQNEEISELADIVEVVYAILAFKGVSIQEFEKLRLGKKEKNGGFDKRLLLKSVFTRG